MRTLIVEAHVVDVVGRFVTQDTATAVCKVLRAVSHIPITADVAYDGSVNLRPGRLLCTAERVTVMRAFTACTDCRLNWHQAVAS